MAPGSKVGGWGGELWVWWGWGQTAVGSGWGVLWGGLGVLSVSAIGGLLLTQTPLLRQNWEEIYVLPGLAGSWAQPD